MRNIHPRFCLIASILFFITLNCSSQTLKYSDEVYENSSIMLDEILQLDIDTLIIDHVGSPLVFGPNKLVNVKNKVIILEKGVEIYAKPGFFLNKSDVLFEFIDSHNVRIIGNQSVVCMNKSEYTTGEWRHGFSFRGCTDMLIKGVQIKDTGGDGIYIAGSANKRYSENICIEDIRSTNNKRQGMSVISVKNLTVSNSVFEDTKGTLPEAGIDFEPNSKDDILEKIIIVNCVFQNNGHSGVLLALNKLKTNSSPISITFLNCVIRRNHHKENKYTASEIIFGADKDNPVKGLVIFKECVIKDSDWGLFYSRKTTSAYDVIFKDCSVENISQDGSYSPIYLEVPDYKSGNYNLGGYTFDNLYISYRTDVPLFLVRGSKLNTLNSVKDIVGDIILNDSGIDRTNTKYINYNPENNNNVNFRVINKYENKQE